MQKLQLPLVASVYTAKLRHNNTAILKCKLVKIVILYNEPCHNIILAQVNKPGSQLRHQRPLQFKMYPFLEQYQFCLQNKPSFHNSFTSARILQYIRYRSRKYPLLLSMEIIQNCSKNSNLNIPTYHLPLCTVANHKQWVQCLWPCRPTSLGLVNLTSPLKMTRKLQKSEYPKTLESRSDPQLYESQ